MEPDIPTMHKYMCVLLALSGPCVLAWSWLSVFLEKSTRLNAQSRELLQSTEGLAPQWQTAAEQVIYSTCQHSRCSSMMLQCFQLQQMPPFIYGDSQTNARRLSDIFILSNQYQPPTGKRSNVLPLVLHVWLHLVCVLKCAWTVYCLQLKKIQHLLHQYLWIFNLSLIVKHISGFAVKLKYSLLFIFCQQNP